MLWTVREHKEGADKIEDKRNDQGRRSGGIGRATKCREYGRRGVLRKVGVTHP
jgi:hypothetical protein